MRGREEGRKRGREVRREGGIHTGYTLQENMRNVLERLL